LEGNTKQTEEENTAQAIEKKIALTIDENTVKRLDENKKQTQEENTAQAIRKKTVDNRWKYSADLLGGEYRADIRGEYSADNGSELSAGDRGDYSEDNWRACRADNVAAYSADNSWSSIHILAEYSIDTRGYHSSKGNRG
jgi:hypothetical protein